MRLPPGPPLPRALQTTLWALRPLELMDRCARRYGDAFTLRSLGSGELVFVTSPEHIRQVFTADPDVLHAGEAAATILLSFVGPRSLLVLDGRAHLRERKLLLPPFHGERMAAYGDTMRAAALELVARWPVGQPFAVMPSLQSLTLRVILRAVFGVEDPARHAGLTATIAALLDMTSTPWRILPVFLGLNLFELLPNLPASRLKREMDRAIHQVIAERRASPADRDVLSLLIAARDEAGRGLDDDDLRDELVTLLVAGHETTATAMAWTLQCLVAAPAILAEVQAQLDDGRTELLDAAIKESLRLRPVVAAVARVLKAPMTIGEWRLSAGMTVAPCIYLTHRRADLWPEPERFLPERFLGGKHDPHAWLPFGGGTRRCLGMAFALYEMRVVLAEILARVSLALPPEGPARPTRRGVTVAPSDGGRLVVTARRSRTPPAARRAS